MTPGAASIRTVLVLVAALLAASAVLVGAAAPAAAHDRLVAAEPEAGAVLAEPPARVALTFSGDVRDATPLLQVLDGDGDPVTAGGPVAEGPLLTAPLAADLPDGTYTVRWEVLSADGHVLSGEHGFAVAAPGAAPPVPAAPPAAAPPAAAAPAPALPAPEPRAEAEPLSPPAGEVAVAVATVAVPVLLVALLATWLVRRRRRRSRSTSR